MTKINRFTIILRGYDVESVVTVAKEAEKYQCFNLEITTNTDGYLDAIEAVTALKLKNVPVGAGTVLNMKLLKEVQHAGASFALSPVVMTEEMITFCKDHGMGSVPGTMSPSEIYKMKELGADVIKVFPAAGLSPRYIRDVMAPLGYIPFMVVGGINAENVSEYFDAGADYAGIGSGICDKEALLRGDFDSLRQNLKKLSELA